MAAKGNNVNRYNMMRNIGGMLDNKVNFCYSNVHSQMMIYLKKSRMELNFVSV